MSNHHRLAWAVRWAILPLVALALVLGPSVVSAEPNCHRHRPPVREHIIFGPLVPGAPPGSAITPYNIPEHLTITVTQGVRTPDAVNYAVNTFHLKVSSVSGNVVVFDVTPMTASSANAALTNSGYFAGPGTITKA